MKYFIIIVLLLIFSLPSMANIAVIVHPSNGATVDQSDISRLFLGKKKAFSDGGQAVPINLAGSDARANFEEKALSKSSSQLKAYWSKLVFTGKGSPPKEVKSEQEMLDLIAKNPNFIGYVSADKVDDSVKVIATF